MKSRGLTAPSGTVERWLFWHEASTRAQGRHVEAASWFEARKAAAIQLGCSPFVLRGERAL